MTKEEAIKYLQQLYPNGGHCWLDEQRIEAIGMAVKALREELVSEDLEVELDKYIKDNFTIDKEQLNRFGIEEKDYMYSMDKSDMEKMVRYFTGNYKIPVSDNLEEVAKLYVSDSLCITGEEDWDDAAIEALNAYKAGAKWQKEQLMKNVIDARVIDTKGNYPSLAYGHIDMMFALEDMKVAEGDKVKLIIIKGD